MATHVFTCVYIRSAVDDRRERRLDSAEINVDTLKKITNKIVVISCSRGIGMY